MLSRYRTSTVHRFWQFFLVLFLTFCLCILHVPFKQGIFREIFTTQTIQPGIKKYEIEDIQGAIAYLEEAMSDERQANNLLNTGKNLIQKAQIYNSLGKPSQAIVLAETALKVARTYKDNSLAALALESRGEAYRLQGDYKQAIADLESSLKLAENLEQADHASTAEKLGITYIYLAQINYNRADLAKEVGDNEEAKIFTKQAEIYDSQALDYLQKSLDIVRQQKDIASEIRVLLYSIPSTYRIQKLQLTTKLQLALLLLERLPDSVNKVYTAIELAQLLQSLPSELPVFLNDCPAHPEEVKALELLNQAVAIAKNLQDQRALSFALGYLAHVYECRQDYQQALQFTQQAQQIAKPETNAQDSLYLWQWQTGRILQAKNLLNEAIATYEQAIDTFHHQPEQTLVSDPHWQLESEHYIEQIYRQLIALRLSLEPEKNLSTNRSQNSQNLKITLTNLDALKLTELQNYFPDNSIIENFKSTKVYSVINNTHTAVFWSLILEDRTAIIVSLPSGETQLKWIKYPSNSLKDEINTFRIGLEKRSDIIYNRAQAQRLYDWIIRPFAKDLELQEVKTLVFIPDKLFHSVPMAALHDGKQFLIEKYAIATIPSMSLMNPSTTKLENLRALAVGVTKDAMVDGHNYEALTNVKQEINQIMKILPGSKQLLDDNFTRDRLQKELYQGNYPIIHIATHGEFSIVPEDTFLITGNNAKLNFRDLYRMVYQLVNSINKVDLLTLTACETARGDVRANLGLAGTAVLAGANSTLASLWSVNDAATVELVTRFYEAWRYQGVSKAEALQKAQQELIALGKKYAHPYYWASFVLVGNWL